MKPCGGRLSNKTGVITGAGSGIGRAAAILFARHGARLALLDCSKEGLDETVRLMPADSKPDIVRVGDAGCESDMSGLFHAAEERWSSLDIIFANAGISGGWSPLLEQTVELWQTVLRINLIGPFLAIRYGAPLLVRSGGGSIICTASVGGIRANAGASAYSASKAGVINLAQTAAYAFSGQNVRVNAICPGLIETGMTEAIFHKARQRGTSHRLGSLNPQKRPGLPEEVAELAMFLASDESSYVNGQAIAVDGGLSSSHPYARETQR